VKLNAQRIFAEETFGENPLKITRRGWKNNRHIGGVLIVMEGKLFSCP